ncbi:hypothetical protein [Catellatospora citrea]|uniref:Uncharacterized protein n=1 Tax=Catellatospora citrea TaxID=53366 RepID=A0A8J3KFZ9_9ACTN|nr:hypothetical protein [Catellatospora citrea]RKE10457.1 hypothetical protein C8E86_5359 [Catellatospora citrea]GIF99037.1 hypothetical protein Cci01nite_41310 [Catellatospora citrea]
MTQHTPADNDRTPAPTGMPRWVKICGLVASVLVAAFLALHLTGNTPSHGGH